MQFNIIKSVIGLMSSSCGTIAEKVSRPIRVMVFDPYPMGLSGNYLTQRLILERLNQDYIYPIVVSPAEGVMLDRFRSLGIECKVLDPPESIAGYGGTVLGNSVFGRLKASYDLIKYNLTIFNYLREQKIDLVYSNCVRAQLSVGLGTLLARVPTLLYIKGKLENSVIDRLCFFSADKLLFQCNQNRDDKYPLLVKMFRKNIHILEPGLDLVHIDNVGRRHHSELQRELNIDSSYVNTVVIGQLSKAKGVHFAIEALSELIGEFPNTRLFIVGDHVIKEYSAYKGELDELISKYSLWDHVFFTGWRTDALAITKLMDIVIHPSLAEGFPFAVLESMCLGKPVISSSVGGVREAIQDGINGFTVEPGDVDEIVSRWKQLISDEGLRKRLGESAQKVIRDNYRIDDKVERLSDMWSGMVGK